MNIYLSLKQILLNQIAVLIRKKSDKNNDDPERILRRLNYLQQALEQIKSYQHNINYQYVIKHFNIELSETEQHQIRELTRKYEDPLQNARKSEKSGFTTQRSETLFTGAAEEQYPKFYGSDADMDDEKTASRNHTSIAPPSWITYRGFAHWLKKQSFIKFKKRNDQEKYKKIWQTILGLKVIDQWDKGRIKANNIVARHGTSQPYIAIHKCGTKEIVKSSLLRLSITQNRIFKFHIDPNDLNTLNAKNTHTRARGSIDMNNDDDNNNVSSSYNSSELNANQLIQGKNLFDQVANKDVLRIVATMLWETNLANSVLEELLHNPRFSMYGIHAKNIADTIAKEMNLNVMSSYDTEVTPLDEQQEHQQNSVEQFSIPSPQRDPVSPERNQYPKGGNVYNAQYAKTHANANPIANANANPNPNPIPNPSATNNHNNNNNNGKPANFSFRPHHNKHIINNDNHPQPPAVMNDHTRYYQEQKYKKKQVHEQQSVPEQEYESPALSPQQRAIQDEPSKPTHRPHSESVVMHENLRDSEIHDYGANQDYDSDEHNEYHDGDDEDESVSNSPLHTPQHIEAIESAERNDNIGFGRGHPRISEEVSSESNTSQQSNQSFIMSSNHSFTHDQTPSTLLSFNNTSSEFTPRFQNQMSRKDSMPFIPEDDDNTKINNENMENEETKIVAQPPIAKSIPSTSIDAEYHDKAGLRRKKSVAERTSYLKRDFVQLKDAERWNKVSARLNAIFDDKVSKTLREYAVEEEFDFQAILDDIEDYPDEPDDSNIMEYMQQSFNWNRRECDKFYRTLKRILMDRAQSRRSSSLAQLMRFSKSELDIGRARGARDSRERESGARDDESKNENENENENRNEMNLNEFNEKWSDALLQKLQKYCIQEEYDLEAIAEDLETFEEENSMIVDEIAKEYNWDADVSKVFVDDLRRFITTDPQIAKKHLSVVDSDDDTD